MNEEQCNIELQKYLPLKDKIFNNNLGTGFILIQSINCVSSPTEQNPNYHFIEISGLENGIGKTLKTSIDLFLRTYHL